MPFSENDLRHMLKRAFAGYAPSSIENTAEPGIPDLNLCLPNGQNVWMECKVVRCPVNPTSLIKMKIQKSQIAWATKRLKLEDTIFIVTALDGFIADEGGKQEAMQICFHRAADIRLLHSGRVTLKEFVTYADLNMTRKQLQTNVPQAVRVMESVVTSESAWPGPEANKDTLMEAIENEQHNPST